MAPRRLTYAGVIVVLGIGDAAMAQGQTPPAPAPASPPPAAQPPPSGDEIVVLANPSERRSIDRTTYVVRDTAEARSSNVLEVLDRVPSLEVSINGQIRLLGRSGVRVQIDGQDVSNPQVVLRGLQGSQVARIEVISNPSAQFSAQGTGGIVNIILRRSFASGIGGSAVGTAGSYGSYTLRLSPTWSRGPFSVSGSVAQYRTVSPGDLETSRTLLDPNGAVLSESSQSGHRRSVGSNWTGNLIAVYRPAAGQSLTFTANASHGDSESAAHSRLETSLNPGNVVTQTEAGTGDFNTRDLQFDYRREVGQQGESLAFSVKRSGYHSLLDLTDVSDSALSGPGVFDLRSDFSSHSTTAKLDYVLPFDSRSRLAFGGSLQRSRLDAISEVTGTLPLTGVPFSNMSTVGGSYTEKAAYLTYQFPWLGGSILAGLRIEGRNYQVDGVTGGSLHSAHLFPSLHLERRLTSTLTAVLSYSRRIEWPNISALSPSLRFFDSTNAVVGNPLLRPNLIDSFELKLSAQLGRQNLEVVAFARQTAGNNATLEELDGNGVLVSRDVNLGTATSRGANLSVRGPLGGGFSYAMEGNLSDEQVDDAGALGAFAQTGLKYSGSTTLEYHDGTEGRRHADHVEVTVRYNGPWRTGFLSIPAYASGTARWSHALTDRLSSVVTVSEFLGPPDPLTRSVSDTTISLRRERPGGPRIAFSLTFSLAPPRR
jgi:outer membrane receptor protein involved in Fe transport